MTLVAPRAGLSISQICVALHNPAIALRWVMQRNSAAMGVVKKMSNAQQAVSEKWNIYIPEEGHWLINYDGDDKAEARAVYLKWAERKRLPTGAFIVRF